MDKSALQSYALWAKSELERQIELSLKLLGVLSVEEIKTAIVQGDVTVIERDSKSYSKDTFYKRNQIIELIKRKGYTQTIEELSYTWFNRIIAIRFMEIHDYLPHGFRVLSSKSGNFEPDVLINLNLVSDELGLDMNYCLNLKDSGKIEELYRYVFFKQCNSLSNILPMLFSEELDYLELLLPQSLLKGDTVITKLLEVGEENFLEDVEVLGWLYQYYIQQKKDEVFGGLKNNTKLTKDTLPAATQIFTPDWIVRYMVDNSLGKLWIENNNNSILKGQLDYYLEPKNIDDNTIDKNLNVEDITFLDDCSGSGHILVYAFDLFYQMYLEKGYFSRDISRLILKKNLFGFDLDKRACQLASFALTMKARKHDPRFFDEDRLLLPNILEIKESNTIPLTFIEALKELNTVSSQDVDTIKYVIDSFRDAKLYGSLIKVDVYDFDSAIESLNRTLEPFSSSKYSTIFTTDLLYSQIPFVINLLKQSKLFIMKFDCVVTNPPYVGNKSLGPQVGKWLNINYSMTKADLFSAFMERNFQFGKTDAYLGFMTPFVWMFIKTYEQLRKTIINTKSISSLIQLEYGGFAEAVVPICTFILNNNNSKRFGEYIRLSDFKGPEIQHVKVLEAISESNVNYRYTCPIYSFDSIPGYPIAYWIGQSLEKIFLKGKLLGDLVPVRKGADTGNNSKYLRYWHEVEMSKINIFNSSFTWVHYNKGGKFRRWYGNNEWVIFWKNDGEELKNSKANLRSKYLYFTQSITWGALTSGKISFRYSYKDSIFDSAGSSFFPEENNAYYLLAIMNSKPIQYILDAINPTLNYGAGSIAKVPIIFDEIEFISNLAKENVMLSKLEWDSFETSWNFSKNPLIDGEQDVLISKVINDWHLIVSKRRLEIHKNEISINKKFIRLYNLEDKLSKSLNRNDNSLYLCSTKDDVKSLISYIVGLIFGRYSLKKNSIMICNDTKDNESYVVDKIPLFSDYNLDNNLSREITYLVKKLFGISNYKANIDFIAQSLGKKGNESSYECVHRYILLDFYGDHLKLYKKRPIYWMLNSGKQKAFKCLVYIHKYNENTLANINSKLFLPHMERLRNEIDSVEFRIKNDTGNGKAKLEKLKNEYTKQLDEMIVYGQVLEHKALEYISLDLDDGVVENYKKFQNIEVPTNSGHTIKMDLLEPIK